MNLKNKIKKDEILDNEIDNDDVEYVDDEEALSEYEKAQIDYDEDLPSEIKRIKQKRKKILKKKTKGE